jgi:hypothetical protein
MRRKAEVIVMRSKRLWFRAIPELEAYSRLHIMRNPRVAVISRGNLPEKGFDLIASRLKGGKQSPRKHS